MTLQDGLWLATAAATALGTAAGLHAVVRQETQRRIEQLEASAKAAHARIESLREKLQTEYVRSDGLSGLRSELKEEMREMRQELRSDMLHLSERHDSSERALHERLGGISRQLERLVGTITRAPHDAAGPV